MINSAKDNQLQLIESIAIDSAEKFSQSHTVNRIHCDLSNLSKNFSDEIIKITPRAA